MMTALKTAALAATLALASAVPAAATVLNFEFFSDSTKTTKLWGVVIDFGDFGFNEPRDNFTTGITLTQPAAPYDTGTAKYDFFPTNNRLSFGVQGQRSDTAAAFSYGFVAECIPICDDGRAPSFSVLSVFNVGFTSIYGDLSSGARSITDVTPPPPAAVIPLPGAGWLLLGALGALGALRRRRA